MSGFELTIRFHGFCLLVPESDKSKMWVFLLNQKNPMQEGVPPHASVVRFPLHHLVKGAPGNGLWPLDKVGVSLSGTDNKGITLAAAPGESFSLVAPLDVACDARGLKGRGTIDPRFKKQTLPVLDAGMLGARFEFTTGTFRSESLSAYGGDLVQSRFKPHSGASMKDDLIQFTASVVAMKVHIDSSSIKFESRSLKDGSPKGELTLSPEADGKEVVVDIMNEEAERIVGIGNIPGIDPGIPRPQDRIFESIFQMCTNPPAPKERPMPIPEKLVPLTGAGKPILDGAPPCNPITSSFTGSSSGNG